MSDDTATGRALATERARLAKVEALPREWEKDTCDTECSHPRCVAIHELVIDLDNALASVPEPSERDKALNALAEFSNEHGLTAVPESSGFEPCTTPGCPGDGRYAAPGRRHVEGCTYPQPSDSEPAPDADREAGGE